MRLRWGNTCKAPKGSGMYTILVAGSWCPYGLFLLGGSVIWRRSGCYLFSALQVSGMNPIIYLWQLVVCLSRLSPSPLSSSRNDLCWFTTPDLAFLTPVDSGHEVTFRLPCSHCSLAREDDWVTLWGALWSTQLPKYFVFAQHRPFPGRGLGVPPLPGV